MNKLNQLELDYIKNKNSINLLCNIWLTIETKDFILSYRRIKYELQKQNKQKQLVSDILKNKHWKKLKKIHMRGIIKQINKEIQSNKGE